MEHFIEFIKYLNIPSLVLLVVALWLFRKDFKKEMKEEREELKEERKEEKEEWKEERREWKENMKLLKEEIYGIHKEFKFINIRLSRVEGTVYGKGIYEKETSE